METKVAKLEESVNDLTKESLSKTTKILELEKKSALVELSEGLSLAESEKLQSLVKDLEASDIETFKAKAKVVKESCFIDSKVEEKDPAPVVKESTNKSQKTLIEQMARLNRRD